MNIVVIGGNGGIGQEFVQQLLAKSETTRLHATYRGVKPAISDPRLRWHRLDVTDERAISEWVKLLENIDWVINAVGMLHTADEGPEKSISRLTVGHFMDSMQINTLPSLIMAKYLHKKFRRSAHTVYATVSAKVGSIEDNRLGGWYSYRMSKAALNMGLKTLAIEWKRAMPMMSVVAIHPGTTDTELSKPFQRNVPEGQLFCPEKTGRLILQVLNNLQQGETGLFLAFDGERLPW